ncbi:Wee1-like protein kinase [Chlorella vulgaris]
MQLNINTSQWPPEDDGETPREPPSGGAALPGSLPASPSARKTKSRAVRAPHRIDSLRGNKVLLVSEMHRTESDMDPSLFQYHDHFDSPWTLVGKTHSSEVFSVRHRASGEVFAVKRSRRRFRSKLQRERCLREIRAVAALPSHPNIVNQYRAWQEGGHFYIQMDFCEGGSLAHQAHRACASGQCMSDEQLWRTACEAAHGLHFLHSNGVLHLDIKPDNLYLAAGTWRIGDFGLAVAREQKASMDWEEGDGDYVAPELLQNGGEPSPACDVFSLGATLFECATGRKLPRSDGWAASDVERLEVPGRPAAFVQLLRAMLQPTPLSRPSAEQVLETVAEQQPSIAAEAAGAVAAAATDANSTARQEATSRSVAVQHAAAAMALVPSPFMQPVQDAACTGSNEAAAAKGSVQQQAAAAAGGGAFSFDVPQNLALTPSQPVHSRQRSSGGCKAGMLPATTVKGTPVGRGRMGGRWAPALSPLISEGALTPGAAAALAGLTPAAFGTSETAPASGSGNGRGVRRGSPLDMWRPAPLQVPPQTAPMMAGTGSVGSMLSMPQPSSSGTQDSRDSWRLRRRDILSPDSDALNASQSDSEYSYSCGTGRTTSDMDFADALSPMALERGSAMAFAAAGPTPSTGTPESLQWQGGEASATPDTDLPSSSRQSAGPGAHGLRALHLQQVGASLAFDLHTSPEFLMQLPPGSPQSLSRSSSLDDSASLPSSRTFSVRRFPTLDSWGSQLPAEGGACHGKPLSRDDSLGAMAAQRYTHTFAPYEQPAAAPAVTGTTAAVPLGARGLRKRQHSSRRTLMAALSRDNSVASSIDGMQPQGKARHIMLDSGPQSPCGNSGDTPLSQLHHTSSTLRREAVAAAVAGLAEAAARALTASGGGTADLKDAVVGHLSPPFRFDSICSATGGDDAVPSSPVVVRPQSPLHARMTCMKLRDVD